MEKSALVEIVFKKNGDFTSVNCILGQRLCFIINLNNPSHSSFLLMSWAIFFSFFLTPLAVPGMPTFQ